MSTKTTTRRRQSRYPVTRDRAACLEFEFPEPNGRHYRLTVSDLSVSGVSFRLEPEELVGLESGATLRKIILRVSECMIEGDLLVMHVTPETESTRYCGALFYPASDRDLLVLKSVVAGMGAIELS